MQSSGCIECWNIGFITLPRPQRLLLLHVGGFRHSRWPISKVSKHGVVPLVIQGHDPPTDITIFLDVAKNPGPTLIGSSCSLDHKWSPSFHTTARNLHNLHNVRLDYTRDDLFAIRRTAHCCPDSSCLGRLKEVGILRYRGSKAGKRSKVYMKIPSSKDYCSNLFWPRSVIWLS